MKNKHLFTFSQLFNKEDKGEGKESKYDLITSIDQLPDDPKPGDKAYVSFNMFRSGEFDHPYYGPLVFDLDYLTKLKTNFDVNVAGRSIHMDLDHSPVRATSTKSYGKILEVEIEELELGSLIGTRSAFCIKGVVELNSLGINILKDGQYEYCSIEIDNEYTTYEREPLPENLLTDDERSEGSSGAVLMYGPTIVGCAFTNRPFIPGLGEVVAFSEGSPVYEKGKVVLSEEQGGVRFFSAEKKENVEIEQSSEDPQPEVPLGPVAMEGASSEKEEGDKMKFQDLIKQMRAFSTVAEQVAFLNENRGELDEAGQVALDAIVESKNSELSQEKATQEFAQRQKQLEAQQTAAIELQAQLRKQLAEAREGEWSGRVSSFAANLRAEGHHESLVQTVEQTLSGLVAESRAQSFSFVSPEGEKTSSNLIDLLKKVFAAIPGSSRLDTSEVTEGGPAEEVVVSPEAPTTQVHSEQPAGEPEGPSEEEVRQAKVQAYTKV